MRKKNDTHMATLSLLNTFRTFCLSFFFFCISQVHQTDGQGYFSIGDS